MRAVRSLRRTTGTVALGWTAFPATTENGRPRTSSPRYIALSTRRRFSATSTLLRSRMKLTSPRGLSGAISIVAKTAPTSAGSATASMRIARSSGLPGAAKARRRSRIWSACWLIAPSRPSVVREDVLVGPSVEVEADARRQELEAGAGDLEPALAGEALLEDFRHPVEEAHVRRRVLALRLAELGRAPVARLLLLGDLLAEQLADDVLEAVAVGIGAHELAGDLGAEHRGRHDPEVVLDRREVEAGEVEQLGPRRIGQRGLEVRRIVGAADAEADEVLVSAAVADLDDAQAIARRDEPHGLGVDGDGARGEHACGQVFFVEMDGHRPHLGAAPPPGNGPRAIGDSGRPTVGRRRSAVLTVAPMSETVPPSWQPVLAPVLATPESRRL